MRAYTIVIDTREHYPLPFPDQLMIRPPRSNPQLAAIKTVKRALDAGDYLLDGFEGECRIERKASILELENNFTTADRGRMLACLAKLKAACRDPIVLVECGASALFRTPLDDLTLSAMFRDCQAASIPLWFVPNSTTISGRRAIGRLVALKLLAAAGETC